MTAPRPWTALPDHRRWLRREADDLLRLFEASPEPGGGFRALGPDGRPRPDDSARPIHHTARMVHCYALAALMGRPGAIEIVDHGLRYLREGHRRPEGGYAWDGAGADPRFTGYGHAFVLLAGASAHMAGHPDGMATLRDAEGILGAHFWDEDAGAIREAFDPDWSEIEPDYRGQNCNMHLAEALMAAFEATGEAVHLRRAERIAELLIHRHARAEGWRVAEHFRGDWTVDRSYGGDPMFRPEGTVPGHAFEWARLLVQMWETGGRRHDWMPEAARALFAPAVRDGWREDGGLRYSIGWDGRAIVAERYWWPVCEAIGAAHAVASLGDPEAEGWYRRFWGFAATHLIDRQHGGWHPQVDDAGRPSSDPFHGKPDIYHALQACLVPLHGMEGSLAVQVGRPR